HFPEQDDGVAVTRLPLGEHLSVRGKGKGVFGLTIANGLVHSTPGDLELAPFLAGACFPHAVAAEIGGGQQRAVCRESPRRTTVRALTAFALTSSELLAGCPVPDIIILPIGHE